MYLKKILRKGTVLFFITIVVLSTIMLFFINQKEGWHPDEVFSYGSSNSKYDNLFYPYGLQDPLTAVVTERILDKNVVTMISNVFSIIANLEDFKSEIRDMRNSGQPIWKTKEEAKDYVTVSTGDSPNYLMVYYNQAKDVHPPLFYFLVNTVSLFIKGTFSKYIIFSIQIIFFTGSCFLIKMTMELLKRAHLSIPVILLYGLSMGAISTVIFQRMYMMLTFFILCYFYINLKLYFNSFKLTGKLRFAFIIVLLSGFLTQYYFCVYAGIVAIIMLAMMIREKSTKEAKAYFIEHLKAAIIGIAIYPPAVFHVFISHRSVAAIGESNGNYLQSLSGYIKMSFNAFSMLNILGYVFFIVLAVALIYIWKTENKRFVIMLILMPIVVYVLAMSKFTPSVSIRYLTPIFPFIVIAVVLGIDWLVKNNRTFALLSVIILIGILPIYGLANGNNFTNNNSANNLNKGYSKYLEIAKQNKNLKFLYVGMDHYLHIQSIEEFMTYDKSMIITKAQLAILERDDVLKNEKEFILGVHKGLDIDYILLKVLEYSNSSEYELLIDRGISPTTSIIIYKIHK